LHIADSQDQAAEKPKAERPSLRIVK